MTESGRRAAVAIIPVLALALNGCEGPIAPAPVSGDVLAGEWVGCRNDGAADHMTTVVFYPDASYLTATRTFGTTNGTCGGAETGASYGSWRYTLGNSVPASLGLAGTSVTAREITVTNAVVTTYSIVYTDGSVTPHVLYFGDLAAESSLDGTTAAKRPRVLSSASGLTQY